MRNKHRKNSPGKSSNNDIADQIARPISSKFRHNSLTGAVENNISTPRTRSSKTL